MEYDYETYLSPFTWRYGSSEMRSIWSEVRKRQIWREIWVALAQVQSEFGLIKPEYIPELRMHVHDVEVERALEIEADIRHDLMAELQVFAGQCGQAGGVLHLGATSMDIEDNADVLRIKESLEILFISLHELLDHFGGQIERWADMPVIGFTHLQPAEPTTLGYRLACYAQDLLDDWEYLQDLRKRLRGKGFKGAVGSAAAFSELLGVENLGDFEKRLSKLLELPFYPVATQVYPRVQDYHLLCALAGLGASLYRFGFDLRLLQSPPVGELGEPFGARQVGSSAMPFKRNPINAEKIDSLARSLAQMPRQAWDNAAHSLLERTLDDSANRRSLLPEAFLIVDELLIVARRIVKDLQVDEGAIERNLADYGPFAATERLLMGLGKAGANRQRMHARLREHSLVAWEALRRQNPNPLIDLVCNDPEFQRYLSQDQIKGLMQAGDYVGDAPKRARELARRIHNL